ENTFKMVHAVGWRSNEDNISMARAYYWLGKPAEGRRLLDDVLKNSKGRPELVESVARLLRAGGAVSDARDVLEKAHAAEQVPPAPVSLAFYRPLGASDLDDRLAWLERSAKDQLDVKVSLLEAQGLKAREQGKDEEAKKLCREALKLYKGMQENFATLNNSALVYFDLYDLEYDPELFKEGVRRMEKALKGQPNSEVVV